MKYIVKRMVYTINRAVPLRNFQNEHQATEREEALGKPTVDQVAGEIGDFNVSY